MEVADLKQAWPSPSQARPVLIVGAGGIVRDAHLPAYLSGGVPVAGIIDPVEERARSLCASFEAGQPYGSLEHALADHGGCIVDLATPPDAHLDVLERLPEGSVVLIQKPMGRNLDQTRQIAELARTKRFTAAVNFQLRFSPMMLAAADAIARGLLGELLEIEVHVNILTHWNQFPFLKALDRVEIAVHSIHYLDMIRALAGDPAGVFARTLSDPRSPDYAQTRTSAILDYGERLRVLVNVNHNHRGGNRFQIARFRLEGTSGTMFVKLGLLYDYPHGQPDELWLCRNGSDWQRIRLTGTWFPDAFAYRMNNLQRYALGEDDHLVSDVQDGERTMALVEACYEANEVAGTPVP